MQPRIQSALEQIKSIEREYYASSKSLTYYKESAKSKPGLIPCLADMKGKAINIERVDFDRSGENLEATYVIRLFAHFEKTLREEWKSFQRDKKSPVKDIIDGLHSRMKNVPQEIKEKSHQFRLFRNGLIHGRRSDTPIMTLTECRSVAATFVSYLQGRRR
ncbi:hypothetical protein [Lacunimicrobium album]